MNLTTKFVTTVIIAVVATAVCLNVSRAQQDAVTPSKPMDTRFGRFEIVKRDGLRADTWLLDKTEGRIWRLTEYGDLPGKPTVWQFEERVDNKEQLSEFIKRGVQSLIDVDKLKNKADVTK